MSAIQFSDEMPMNENCGDFGRSSRAVCQTFAKHSHLQNTGTRPSTFLNSNRQQPDCRSKVSKYTIESLYAPNSLPQFRASFVFEMYNTLLVEEIIGVVPPRVLAAENTGNNTIHRVQSHPHSCNNRLD